MIAERIVLAVKAMNEDERIELAKELAMFLCPGVDMIELERAKAKAKPVALSDALRGTTATVVIEDDMEAMVERGAPKGRAGGKKGKRPYWLKRPTSLIEGKKGGYGIEGDWVGRMSDLPLGTRVVLGASIATVSKWAVLEVTSGGAASIEASEDLTFTIDNARVLVGLTKDWSRITSALK